jgi:SAM-dependent methyltransferase
MTGAAGTGGSGGTGATAPPADEAAIWHDVECAGYTADLALWRELARETDGPVLEIGAGTGRVTLDLAERGHRLTALDREPALVAELARRARDRGLRVDATAGDARSFALGRRFSLVLAPMQVTQLLGGSGGRRSMLAAVRGHMEPGAVLALALADPLDGLPLNDALPPLPDVRELDGWVYSSRPVAMRETAEGIAIERVREAVSPDGSLRESAATVILDGVDAGDLADTAEREGFRRLPPRSVPATESYVGSRIVMLRAS